MQLVEEHKLRLDDPISKYGVDLNNPQITVKQLLTHTSEGSPGSSFQYNGYRYGRLGPVLEQAARMPFYQLLVERILIPLKMTSSAPAISLDQFYAYTRQNQTALPFFDTTFTRLAKPYELNSQGKIVRGEYLNEFGAFGGLATTAGDLLKYSDAIDANRLISASAQKQVFTANRTKEGVRTPYGLGWFVQNYQGTDFYWHYGQTPGESALFIKVPALQLTLAVLCNTDKLSQPFPLGDGDLFMSPVGQLFYRCFILNEKKILPDLVNKELIVNATMALMNRDTVQAQQLYTAYAKKNFTTTGTVPSGMMIAQIRDVSVNKDLSCPFSLTTSTQIRVYGTGENCSGDGSFWCDSGWIENAAGKVVWQMQGQPVVHAGGALKNQKVNQEITLPAGRYLLRYKSDAGHAYNNWDSLPPEQFFWGILLLNTTQ